MRICYFGFYAPKHSRNTTFIEALHKAGHSVEEINSGTRGGIAKYVYLARQLRKRRAEFDAVVVGFPGHQAAIIARLVYRGPVLLNALLSLHDAVVGDRREVSVWHPYARYLWFVDYVASRAADVTILDCEAYITYWMRTYGVPHARFARVFLSADEERLSPLELSEEPLTVHYYSSFIPSHGTDTIVRAAALVKNDGITFVLSGDGPCRARDAALAQELGADNVSFVPRLPNLEALNRFINSSWVSLGLFSASAKADRAIANKVVEALYCGRPVITAATSGTKELLTDGKDAFLCLPDSPESLAEKLRLAKQDDALRQRVAAEGKKTYDTRASLACAGRELTKAIESAQARRISL